MVIVKANPGILKRGGGIKMWIWLFVERESCLGFRNKFGMRKIGRNIVRQKKILREQYIWLWILKAREAAEKVDSCRDGRGLFRIAKQRIGKKKYVVWVSSFKDESGAVKVWMIVRKSGRSIWES